MDIGKDANGSADQQWSLYPECYSPSEVVVDPAPEWSAQSCPRSEKHICVALEDTSPTQINYICEDDNADRVDASSSHACYCSRHDESLHTSGDGAQACPNSEETQGGKVRPATTNNIRQAAVDRSEDSYREEVGGPEPLSLIGGIEC